jgi:hypothetical protein
VKVTDTKDSVRQLPKDKAKTSLAEKLEVRQAAQLEETATASGSESANAAQMTDEESEMLHLEEGPLLLLPAETSVQNSHSSSRHVWNRRCPDKNVASLLTLSHVSSKRHLLRMFWDASASLSGQGMSTSRTSLLVTAKSRRP